MSARDRAWLRAFLNLAARAAGNVPIQDIERQEDTVLRALSLLDTQPGVVLADEVGMGKTYEALGVLAARLHERPHSRALILTPGPDLNTKWRKELAAFSEGAPAMYAAFAGRYATATTLGQLVEAAHQRAVVVAPVNIFAGSRSLSDQAYLLSLWCDEQGLAGNQSAALFRRYRSGATGRVSVEGTPFLGLFAWKAVRPHVREALAAHRRTGDASLDVLWNSAGYDAFADQAAVDHALADLRFRLVGRLLPELDLLIVDEAHKLKNADSMRATGVRTVFERRFDKALFLTATPFQLTVEELRQVFALFALAAGAPGDLMERADRLLGHVADYARAYEDLERIWSQIDSTVAADFSSWFERDPDLALIPDDPTLRTVVERAQRLLKHKRERIEPGFRSWMIRSLRPDKRTYRRKAPQRLPEHSGPGVPFLLYERFIAELFRSRSRTHKAAVQINMVSSYSAAREGALLADEVKAQLGGDAESYRKLLQEVIGALRDERGGHPKVAHVVRDALTAAEHGEKTLVFCARVQTLRELRREIEAEWKDRLVERWRRVYPGATHEDVFGHRVGLRERFQSVHDALYLALREGYVTTLLDAGDFAAAHLEEIVARANGILREQRVTKTSSERIDWGLVKRCVEQATALALQAAGLAGDVHPDALAQLTDPRYIALGYDLEEDDVETSSRGDFVPRWSIHGADAVLVIRREHLWCYLKSALFEIPPDLRVRTVEQLARYLVSRNLPFLPEMLAHVQADGVDVDAIESRALLPAIDRMWTTPAGRPWCDLLRRFLLYAARLPGERRKEVLDDVVLADTIVRHTEDAESRERLREAFNTPLYPMVLIANEVMQEGLDLHHHCRRVIHHDLAWNPAQLEQRVGRVDRLGSLVQKLREKQPDTKLDIGLPLIAHTIDERLERTVRLRERWLEFLLGAAPRIDEYGLADDPPPPLPLAFAEALRVELGP